MIIPKYSKSSTINHDSCYDDGCGIMSILSFTISVIEVVITINHLNDHLNSTL